MMTPIREIHPPPKLRLLSPRFLALAGALVLAPLAPSLHAALTQPVVPVAPAAPSIPATRTSLADFGAVPDGQTLNTVALARAIETLAGKGGGTLVVPAGIWLTGPIELRRGGPRGRPRALASGAPIGGKQRQ